MQKSYKRSKKMQNSGTRSIKIVRFLLESIRFTLSKHFDLRSIACFCFRSSEERSTIAFKTATGNGRYFGSRAAKIRHQQGGSHTFLVGASEEKRPTLAVASFFTHVGHFFVHLFNNISLNYGRPKHTRNVRTSSKTKQAGNGPSQRHI